MTSFLSMQNSDIKHREAWICETFGGYEIKFETFSQSFKSTEYTGRIVYKTLQAKIPPPSKRPSNKCN